MKAFLRVVPVLCAVGVVGGFVANIVPENIYGVLLFILWLGVCGVIGWYGDRLADKFWGVFGK